MLPANLLPELPWEAVQSRLACEDMRKKLALLQCYWVRRRRLAALRCVYPSRARPHRQFDLRGLLPIRPLLCVGGAILRPVPFFVAVGATVEAAMRANDAILRAFASSEVVIVAFLWVVGVVAAFAALARWTEPFVP